MIILCCVTIFLSAALVFLIQPMVGKMVLPLFGGSASVWNTCVVFFQALLLVGYAYTHYSVKILGVRWQPIGHLLVMALPFFVLPIAISYQWAPTPGIFPALWLLLLLLAQVGLPYFVVTTTTPLLQRWFAESGHKHAADPYFLYAASNLGSMLALLSYPLIWEPFMPLHLHSWIWMIGYGILIVLMLGCFVIIRQNSSNQTHALNPHNSKTHPNSTTDVNALSRIRWMILAFIPSSLLLSVTTHLTTDVAPIPLLWVTPLAIYLLTFILAFGKPRKTFVWGVRRAMPLVVLLLTILLLAQGNELPMLFSIPLYLLGFFVLAMTCHATLAEERPAASHLTEFYLWLSLGGVLGGAFNVLLAPLVFDRLVEFPLMLVLACVMQCPIKLTTKSTKAKGKKQAVPTLRSRIVPFLWLDLLPAASVGVLAVILIFIGKWIRLEPGPLAIGLLFGIPGVLCYTMLDRPIRFGLGIGALFLAGILYQGGGGRVHFSERTFYGMHRVEESPDSNFLVLYHGNTIHGKEHYLIKQDEPLMYYHKQSPIGQVYSRTATTQQAEWQIASAIGIAATPANWVTPIQLQTATQGDSIKEKPAQVNSVAVVGLGVGTLAYYGQQGQNWTFYEIDPTVVRIAKDYFHYLKKSAADISIELGDARINLAREKNKKFDLLVLDAFNSDALPLHLLTKQALEIYHSRLTKNGVIAFHISNRFVDLKPVLAELVSHINKESAKKGSDKRWECYSWDDGKSYAKDSGKVQSQWVIMGPTDSALRGITRGSMWQKLEGGRPEFLWTDDYSNLIRLFKWGQ